MACPSGNSPSTSGTRIPDSRSARTSTFCPTPMSGRSERSTAGGCVSAKSLTQHRRNSPGKSLSYSCADRPPIDPNNGKLQAQTTSEHLTRHHNALHLVGTFVDLRDLRVPHHPLQRV